MWLLPLGKSFKECYSNFPRFSVCQISNYHFYLLKIKYFFFQENINLFSHHHNILKSHKFPRNRNHCDRWKYSSSFLICRDKYLGNGDSETCVCVCTVLVSVPTKSQMPITWYHIVFTWEGGIGITAFMLSIIDTEAQLLWILKKKTSKKKGLTYWL